MRASRVPLLVTLGIALGAGEAHASKFTGPKSATVSCRVLRVLADREPLPEPRPADAGHPRIVWVLEPAAGESIAEVEVLSVDAYDSNGWNNSPKEFVPERLFLTLPTSQARKGSSGRALLHYAPGYEGKLSITHVRIEAKWVVAASPTSP